jgi:transcriptional regulator with PAS, ATPase and Fis domain
VLQEKQVVPVGDTHPRSIDVRVISATNRNLEDMVKNETFRVELFFRLTVVTLTLPPLRERVEDILPLADHFLRVLAELYYEQKKKLSPEVKVALCRYGWPGNIRQLANVMEHAHVVSSEQKVQLDDVSQLLPKGSFYSTDHNTALTLAELQRQAIIESLKRTKYCKAVASRLLGVNIQRFNRMIKRLDIHIP